jgi:hypothetical protein
LRNLAALAALFAVAWGSSPAFAATAPAATPSLADTTVAQTSPDAAAVTGTVRDTNGAPIPGARVTLTGATTMSTTSASDGSFLLSVPPGTYRVDISKGGYAATSLQHYTVSASGSTPLSVSLNQADLSSLRTIGQTSAASRGGTSVNTSAATSDYLPARAFTNLANPQINDVLQHLPDVTIQHMGSQPDTSIIVGGVQPYETQVLIDGHPLALGQYGVWTSQYYPSYLVGGVESESGPGNTTPFANLAVGGTVNLLTPGFTRNQTADLTYGVDNYSAQYSHFTTTGAVGPVQYVAALGVDGTNGPYAGTVKCIVSPDFAGALDNKAGNKGIIQDCQDATGSFFNKGEAFKLRFNFSNATSFEAGFVGAWGGYNPQGTAWGTFLGQTTIEPCLTSSPLKCTNAKYSGLTGSTIDGFGWYTGSSVYNNQTLFDGQLRTTFGNNTLLVRPYVGDIEPEVILGSGQTSSPAFFGPAPGSANYVAPTYPNGATIPATFTGATGNAFEQECANNYDNVANQLGKSVVIKGQQECFGGAYTTYEQDKLYGSTFSILHPIGTGVLNLTYDFHGQSTFAYINNPAGVSVPFSTDRYSTFSLTGTAQAAHNLNIDAGLYDTLWNVIGVKPTSVTDATLIGFDRSVSRFDPHVALVYHPVSSVAYRAAWGTSATFPFVGQVSGLATYQTPANSLGPPFEYGGTLTEKNSDLSPEVSSSYNVGVDKRFGNASIVSLDLGDSTIHNVFETLTTTTINPQTQGLEGIFSPVNVARLRSTSATLKYAYAPFSGFGFNLSAAAERSILDGLPTSAFSAGTASVPANGVQICGNGVAAPGIATCIPYLKGYGQLTYTARDRSFAAIGVDYEGKNNAYFQPPFAMVDATYRRAVSRNAELQISAQNALNTNNYGSYLAMPGLGTPLVAGTLTAKGQLAQTSFTPTLVSAPPRIVRVQLRLHMGR